MAKGKNPQLLKLLKQTLEPKLDIAKIDLSSVSPDARKLLRRKQALYADVARARLVNRDIDEELLRLLRGGGSLPPNIPPSVMCW